VRKTETEVKHAPTANCFHGNLTITTSAHPGGGVLHFGTMLLIYKNTSTILE